MKLKWSKAFSRLNLLERIIHCIENAQIPYNVEEWDTGNGNAEVHKERMKQNQTEVFYLILLNCLFNCLLLIPLGVLGKVASNNIQIAYY